MKKQFLILFTSLISFGGVNNVVYAAPPVVDMSQAATRQEADSLEIDQGEAINSSRSSVRANEPADQRISRLERQMSNLTDMNLVSKLEKMQQELQQLRGQLEVQNHEMVQLKDQLRNFYQDLDQRLTKSGEQAPNKKSTPAPVQANKSENLSDDSTDSSDSSKELQTYETAFNLLNKKDYDKAVTAFQNFTKSYPNSSYSVNAHYWLGEIFYLKEKPDLANKEFQIIIAKYPSSQKVPDAMLKLALLSMDSGNYAKAKQHLQKLQKEYPGTTAAKAAAVHLKEIKARG